MAFPLPAGLRATKRAQADDATPRTPLTLRARRLAARALPRLAGLRTAAMVTTGLGLLDAAVFRVNVTAGIAAAGVCVLLLEALRDDA